MDSDLVQTTEAAQIIDQGISTTSRWAMQGKIPVRKIDGKYWYSRTELLQWLQDRPLRPAQRNRLREALRQLHRRAS